MDDADTHVSASIDRNRRRYGRADDELVGYYSAAVGVRAQSYDPSSHVFDSNEAHAARLRAMCFLSRGVGLREWFDRVSQSVAAMPIETRRVLTLVYTPHGWPTWLASAFATQWGGGNFVALAATLPRAATAAKGKPTIEHFLSRGVNAKDALVRGLRDDCEELRIPALAAYDVVRAERVKRETAIAREAKRAREERNAALLEEELEMDRRIARARYERRLARRAS